VSVAAAMSGLYRGLGAAAVAGLRAAVAVTRDANSQRSVRLRERLGRWQGGAPQGDWVWVHAASVGEAKLAAALVAALGRDLDARPAPTFVVTCQTPTGCRTARDAGLANVHYFPLDSRPVLMPLLVSGRLLLYVSIETELWPTLLVELARAGVATAIANARISAASMSRYRWVRALFAPGLAGLSAVCARDATSAARLEMLGVAGAVTTVTGDIKFDLVTSGEQIRKPLVAIDRARPLLVAASTHEGEEEVALDAFSQLRRETPGLRLALVPRHPQRGIQVAAASASRGLAVALWSGLREGQRGGSDLQAEADWDVLVVDRIGLLIDALATASAAFVGGSLGRGPGGHNLLEVVGQHLRVITGPFLHNVTEQVQLLEEAAAIVVVRDADQLARAWREELADPQASRAAADRALVALAARRGALARTVAVLAPLVCAAQRAGGARR